MIPARSTPLIRGAREVRAATTIATARTRRARLPVAAAVAAALAVLVLAGCRAADPNAGLDATRVPDERATAAYWARQPATASARHDDFDALWRACRRATVGASYVIDRVDFRGGRLTTLPLVSKQAFEVWRNDVATIGDVGESTLATVRRTVDWNVARLDDGSFEATPTVIVERYAATERRLTSAMQYQEIFSNEHLVEGNRLRDQGVDVPVEYWYATGRDRALERRLVRSVESSIR